MLFQLSTALDADKQEGAQVANVHQNLQKRAFSLAVCDLSSKNRHGDQTKLVLSCYRKALEHKTRIIFVHSRRSKINDYNQRLR